MLAALAPLSPAFAQTRYPSQSIRLIAPYAPGGTVDILSRQLAEPMRASLAQSVIVENRGGAGGTLGADAVAILKESVDAFEHAGWVMDLPPAYDAKMRAGIVAFDLPVARLETKLKLSQNRSEADRAGVIAGIAASPRPGDREVADLMGRQAPGG